jgi:ATP synthase F1 gamma subunit
MAYIKDIKDEIVEVESLMDLTRVFGEIASTRMRKIRGYVLKNREYLASINSIFQDVLGGYAKKLAEMLKEGKIKKGGKVTFLSHNGKTVSVLISANTGFFGAVVKETYKKFAEDVKKMDTEVTIVGKIGRSLFSGDFPKTPYVYFDMPDFGVDPIKLSQVIGHLVQYSDIKVYYGKFVSVVTQKPQTDVISSGTTVEEDSGETKVSYLFEPSVEEILMFFEKQIFASLFDQSIRESQLAKFASRILAMDRASQNVTNRIEDLTRERMQLVHSINNTKQLNSLSSLVINKN